MVAPVVFLSLAAVLINDVKAEMADSAVTVDIATSDPVAASDVRIASGGTRRLYVYLDGSMTNRTSFGPSDSIIVHPRARYTKLEVPTPKSCAELASVTPTPTGVRLRVACRDRATAGTEVLPAQVQAAARAERPLPEPSATALARGKQSSASLRAALALPPELTADSRTAGGTAQEPAERAKTAPKVEAERPEQERTKPTAQASGNGKADVVAVPAKVLATQTPAMESHPAGVSDAVPGGQARSYASSVATALGAVILLAAAVVLARFAKRRITRERMIRIVETASIGSRRALVLACVGNRTMVLGVSEAGVSLLDAQATAGPLGSPVDAKPNGPVEDAALGLRNLAVAAGFAQDEKAEGAEHESSLLGRLFRRRGRAVEGPEREEFDQLFSESLEDEDLRRKLAMGQSGRVA
jgi:flagellar protein FliO/FliZ